MEKLLTRKEAAGLLGISIATLDAARTNGQIAFVQYVENGCVYDNIVSKREVSRNLIKYAQEKKAREGEIYYGATFSEYMQKVLMQNASMAFGKHFETE